MPTNCDALVSGWSQRVVNPWGLAAQRLGLRGGPRRCPVWLLDWACKWCWRHLLTWELLWKRLGLVIFNLRRLSSVTRVRIRRLATFSVRCKLLLSRYVKRRRGLIVWTIRRLLMSSTLFCKLRARFKVVGLSRLRLITFRLLINRCHRVTCGKNISIGLVVRRLMMRRVVIRRLRSRLVNTCLLFLVRSRSRRCPLGRRLFWLCSRGKKVRNACRASILRRNRDRRLTVFGIVSVFTSRLFSRLSAILGRCRLGLLTMKRFLVLRRFMRSRADNWVRVFRLVWLTFCWWRRRCRRMGVRVRRRVVTLVLVVGFRRSRTITIRVRLLNSMVGVIGKRCRRSRLIATRFGVRRCRVIVRAMGRTLVARWLRVA